MQQNNQLFWSKIKNMRKVKPPVQKVIEGKTGEDIASLFAAKYRELYNSVSYDRGWSNEFKLQLSDNIMANCRTGLCQVSHYFNEVEVMSNIKTLKKHKSHAIERLSTNNFIFGSELLVKNLALLFSKMLLTGEIPEKMCISTLVPIPKDTRKSLVDSSNYRNIALSSIMLKILEKILLQRNVAVFETSPL